MPVVQTNETRSLGFIMLPIPVLYDPRLNTTQKMLYAALRRFSREDGKCFPGVKRLASSLSISDRSVQRNMKALVDRGLVKIQQRPLETNLYFIMEPEDVYAKDRSGKLTDETIQFLYDAGETKTVDKILREREYLADFCGDDILTHVQSSSVPELSGDSSSSQLEERLPGEYSGVPVEQLSGDKPVVKKIRWEEAMQHKKQLLQASGSALDKRQAARERRSSVPKTKKVISEPEYTGGSSDSEASLSIGRLQQAWNSALITTFPNKPGLGIKWTIKQMSQVNDVIRRYEDTGVSRSDIFWAFVESVLRWQELSSSHRIRAEIPNISLVCACSVSLFPNLLEDRASKKNRK